MKKKCEGFHWKISKCSNKCFCKVALPIPWDESMVRTLTQSAYSSSSAFCCLLPLSFLHFSHCSKWLEQNLISSVPISSTPLLQFPIQHLLLFALLSIVSLCSTFSSSLALPQNPLKNLRACKIHSQPTRTHIYFNPGPFFVFLCSLSVLT